MSPSSSTDKTEQVADLQIEALSVLHAKLADEGKRKLKRKLCKLSTDLTNSKKKAKFWEEAAIEWSQQVQEFGEYSRRKLLDTHSLLSFSTDSGLRMTKAERDKSKDSLFELHTRIGEIMLHTSSDEESTDEQ